MYLFLGQMEQVHLFLACYPFYVQLEYKELYIRHERSMYDLLCAGCWNPVCAEFYLHTPCAIRRAPLPSLTSNISHPAFTPHPASHIPHPTSHIPHPTSRIHPTRRIRPISHIYAASHILHPTFHLKHLRVSGRRHSKAVQKGGDNGSAFVIGGCGGEFAGAGRRWQR